MGKTRFILSGLILMVLLAFTASVASAGKPLVITSPTSGETVAGTFLVAGGGDGRAVEVSIDYAAWQPAEGAKSWTYTWNTTQIADGPHTVYARYTDLSEEISVSVQVLNGGGGDVCAVNAGEVVINEVLPAPSSGGRMSSEPIAVGSSAGGAGRAGSTVIAGGASAFACACGAVSVPRK